MSDDFRSVGLTYLVRTECRSNGCDEHGTCGFEVQHRYNAQFAAALPTFANLLIPNFFPLRLPSLNFAVTSITY